MREGVEVPLKDRKAFGIKNMEEIGMLKPLEKHQKDKRVLMKHLIKFYYTVRRGLKFSHHLEKRREVRFDVEVHFQNRDGRYPVRHPPKNPVDHER